MDDPAAPKSKCIDKVIFTFFGIASLLGWNALLTELDFFNFFLPDIEPFTSFSFMNYFLNIAFQFILLYKKNIFSLFTELMIGILGSIFFLIALPLSAMFLGRNTMANKVITSLLVVLMGFTNACAAGGFFGYTGYFPLEMIVSFTAGQGISGIGLNILQFIVIASVKISDEEKKFIVRGWIFFGFSILILIICLVFLLYSYKDEYCNYYLNKGSNPDKVIEKSEAKLLKSMTGDDDYDHNINDDGKNHQIETLDNDYRRERENDINMVKIVPSFTYVFKKIWDLEIMVCLCYVVTFILFPNACTSQQVFNIGDYNSVTIIAVYNAFDTVGRFIVKYLPQNKKLDFGIVIGRIVLIFTIIFNHYCQVKLGANLAATSILIIIYAGLLGVTNGIGASLNFSLASKNAEDEIKEQVGNSIGFFSILGIFLGSVLAFGSKAIINSIGKNPNLKV